jgi:hypothetical protein
MAQAVDSQFDTAVVAAFEAVLVSAGGSYRSGECFGTTNVGPRVVAWIGSAAGAQA